MTDQEFPLVIDGEQTLIGSAGELVAALNVLQGHHDREALEQLRPHLSKILAGPSGLFATLKVINSEDQVYLFKALGADLIRTMKTPEALRDILAVLADDFIIKWLSGF